jgi:hypothetical protein
MEHLVPSHIMGHSDRYNILYKMQHGFRKKLHVVSCETQLIEFIDDVTKNIDNVNGQQTDCLIMDFSKAFDKVSHSLLVHKLQHYGIQGKTNRWIKSFLSGRTQCVLVEGEKSSFIDVKSGVPQGLGSSLFLFYINDMPDDIKSTVRLFADDMTVYLTVSSFDITLQEDLDKLAIWEVKWMMKFHPDKCQVLAITKKKTLIKKNYNLHDHTLEHVPSAKYLGVTIRLQISNVKREGRTLFLLSKVKVEFWHLFSLQKRFSLCSYHNIKKQKTTIFALILWQEQRLNHF